MPATDLAPDSLAALVGEWATLPDAAQALATDVLKVRQLLREHQLVAVRRDGVLVVPALLLQDGQVVKGLAGLLTLLTDARYTDEEAVRWMFTEDDSLPGRPVDALRENRGTEVRRRAQALGF
ncbi:MAG: Rv2175c family DNA-binding protein [Actinomycetes bacterium]